MQTSQSISKRILAAFSFFTRLPLWRITTIGKNHYERVVPLWGLTGWLTGGVMALTCPAAVWIGLSPDIAIILALVSRVLLTGALHEDGFADFCDGFGGGTDRESVLRIMKDSHIGTYGVIGLLLYYLMMWNLMRVLACLWFFPLVIIAADTTGKYLSSFIIRFLPYARKADEAKNRLVYTPADTADLVVSSVTGLLPLVCLCVVTGPACLLCLASSACCCAFLFFLMYKRIQGYTGDCCGACFLLTELVFYVTLYIMAI